MLPEILNGVPELCTRDDLDGYGKAVVGEMNEIGAKGRNKLRKQMSNLGYTEDQIELVVPTRAYREKREMPKRCFECIKRALGVVGDDLPRVRGFWNPSRISSSANAIASEYDGHLESIVCNLSKFRNFLSGCGLTRNEYLSSYLPDITAERRALRGETTKARGMKGIGLPEPFEKISDLTDRVEEYLSEDRPEITPNLLADLMVALCLRPGEIYTVFPTSYGISGILKKRDRTGESYPIISAIGKDLATRFLELWSNVPFSLKQAADSELDYLLDEWGIKKRDLRAIGCNLAIRASSMNYPTTMYRNKSVGVSALRHAVPSHSSFDHYSRVVDPYISIAAEIAELDNDKRNQVISIVKEHRKKYRFTPS